VSRLVSKSWITLCVGTVFAPFAFYLLSTGMGDALVRVCPRFEHLFKRSMPNVRVTGLHRYGGLEHRKGKVGQVHLMSHGFPEGPAPEER